MKQYEITFIIDPVLPGDEILTVGKAYEELIKNEDCEIVHIEDAGLKQLAYPINRRNSGVYKCIEFKTESGAVIPKVELAMRRDERIMRFLTVKLDKHGVKYNEDKREGRIGKKPSVIEDIPKQDTPVVKEDLTLIEGIGPKIAKLLDTAGIKSYQQLASQSIEDITSILSKGGSNYMGHDPSTWPQQAQLADEGKWAELNTLKDELIAGIFPNTNPSSKISEQKSEEE